MPVEAPPPVQDKPTVKPRDPGQLAVSRRRLDELHDPVARAERAKAIASLLREEWVSIAPHVGLPLSELDRFVADMTERALRNLERQLQCELDPGCDRDAIRKAPGMSQDDSIAASLGPERYARFKAFQDSYRERNVVFLLNQQLPAASAVDDATAERLVQTLGAMRKQFFQNAEGMGEKVDGQGQVFGSAPAGAYDEFAQRRQSAAEYARRELQIAAGILNAEQLAALKSQLDRDLFSFSDRMKNAEVAAAAKAAAGQP